MSGLNANTADHPLHPLGHQGQFGWVSHPVTTSVNLNGTLQCYKKTIPIHLEASTALSAVINLTSLQFSIVLLGRACSGALAPISKLKHTKS